MFKYYEDRPILYNEEKLDILRELMQDRVRNATEEGAEEELEREINILKQAIGELADGEQASSIVIALSVLLEDVVEQYKIHSILDDVLRD